MTIVEIPSRNRKIPKEASAGQRTVVRWLFNAVDTSWEPSDKAVRFSESIENQDALDSRRDNEFEIRHRHRKRDSGQQPNPSRKLREGFRMLKKNHSCTKILPATMQEGFVIFNTCTKILPATIRMGTPNQARCATGEGAPQDGVVVAREGVRPSSSTLQVRSSNRKEGQRVYGWGDVHVETEVARGEGAREEPGLWLDAQRRRGSTSGERRRRRRRRRMAQRAVRGTFEEMRHELTDNLEELNVLKGVYSGEE
ncbi:hypothetical protein DFH08DRAFT_828444 [Mycena albidolilacea]|uniref:Uncharacterized protein n=1 Tax=Mycena albidolilacea TaxID=1033008 RepID=A0AAD6YW12_9AGAR|nr:hypothetical protein DFH08DRAFT_828444 [Mycena albidolilacea]